MKKSRKKVCDHIDVVMGEFNEFVTDLFVARQEILKKHPEAKNSQISVSWGATNISVQVNFKRWATEEELEKIEEQQQEIDKDVKEYFCNINKDDSE